MTTARESAERDAELRALREAVSDLVAGCGGISAARRQLDAGTGIDDNAWRLLGREMGLAGLGIAEEAGGAGGGLAELAAVAEELGRSLLPVPFLSSTVLAGQILARCADTGELLGRMSAGETRAAFAGVDRDGSWRPERLSVQAERTAASSEAPGPPVGARRTAASSEAPGPPVGARRTAASWQLSGTADFVLDGVGADHLVVAAGTPDGCDLFLVNGDAAGVEVRALEVLDPTRGQASVRLDGAPAEALTSGGGGADVVGAALNVVLVVLAAEQIGGTSACLDMAADYAKIRHQFSRPIGSFQAIKHKLADLLLQVEMGRSALDRALLADGDPAALAEAAAVAKIWCSDAYTLVASENVHINGGTGFTWEHDAHLYFRRARADEVLFGDATVHRERLAALLAW
jgi:alkylation response protein AidB-like acyl-CoA dehydrogenase